MSATFDAPRLDARAIDALSRDTGDPEPVARRRRVAFERYGELPLEPDPLYRQYGYFAGVELDEIDPRVHGAPLVVPPPAAGTVQVVHDRSGTRVRTAPDLERAGRVRLTSLTELWQGPEEAREGFLGATPEVDDRLSALSAALLNRGYRLEVRGGGEAPVRVQDVTVLCEPHEALAVRRQIVAAPDTRVVLTEEAHAVPAPDGAQRLLSSTTELKIGASAEVTALALHVPDLRTVGVYHRRADLDAAARVTWIWSGFGGFRTKVRNRTQLRGNGSSADDLQTFFGDGSQSYDSGIVVTHVGTDTHGQSITRGVFRDEARGMSRGLVRIEKEARKTLSYLSEHAMLLSKGARSDTIPILEILCRDVKATHSSSVAPVDPEKVFYLEARGLPADSAVRMIGEGFLSHVLERAPVPNLREVLYPYLARRWERQPLDWDPERSMLPPDLRPAAGELGTDWRFDAKLR